ncbi:FAST kinase domain-containing protein 5, mitochondrial [Hyla sarda]|uniref:FAST kinase domain-containing protein 5, mitochondrial n=1 Tax=Hyla sarda TaxID=327740 RepID=UPI0024C45B1B|nr:FAST kinase domain-containing protein 5, mitochondrial [Hyla sarda]XP_056409405.1 FAST kinase domain-containing protein 5, mitochondrial [Hyla sarda]XP_056409411.1 FAST kinase domain-containing protein 5, mitochondrial [Hyla sarda]XP_056409412.1 FAST kinase domain-containing protein 5, mitochondrial [Hyla sarda]
MATALCRGLQGGIFRTATFSSFTRWTSAKHPDKLRTILIQPASYFKKADNARDLQDSSKPLEYSSKINNLETGQAEHDSKQQYLKPNIRPRVKKLVLPRENPSEKLAKIYRQSRTETIYNEAESYDSMADPRGFQQSRPEYKSLCYNSEHTMCISAEEGETLLQKLACIDDLAPADVYEFLEKLSHLPEDHIDRLKSNKHFEKLCSRSMEVLQLYTHGDLICILHALVPLKASVSRPMLKAYEEEFSRRVWYLSTNELLLVADMWRCLSYSVPKFLAIMYSYMHLRCMDLNLAQAIQLIYIIGEGRHAPEELMEKLEAVVLRYLQAINLEEIGTICLGYFKTGHGLSEYLMRKFGDRVVENINDISNYALVNILKMFRFTRVDHMDFFKRVGQVARDRIPNMGIQGIMHMTLSFSSMHVLDEDLMNTVASVIPDRVSYCRSKDIAKLLWSFGILTYNPPNADIFYSALINEIYKNLQEFKTFPEHFLTCLMALAFCQRFPLDLIEVALSEEFLIQSTKISMYELKKDLFTIAGSVEIECPEYTGKTISPELRQEVTEMLINFSNQDIYVKEEALEAASMLEILLEGAEFVKHHMILPHTRSKDLEVHFDMNNKPIPLKANVKVAQSKKKPIGIQVTDDLMSRLLNKNQTPGDAKSSSRAKSTTKITEDLLSRLTTREKLTKIPATEVTKLAIQVTNRNHYCYGRKRLLGLHDMKRRQLRKLGYVVVELPHWEWYPLSKRSQSEKLSYLHHKVFGSLERVR